MSFLRPHDVYADGYKTAKENPLDIDGYLLGCADYSSFGEVKNGGVGLRLYFMVKTYARWGIRQKTTVGFCQFYPYAYARISRKPHTSKRDEIGGRYALNRIYWANSPIEHEEKLHKKTLGGNPKCFCIVCRILKVDAIENPACFQVF